jgi:NTP pyrophosphatase (non-canonical NTP hydrolase)
VEFNKTFGIPVATAPRKDVFVEDPKLVKFRMDLIREEMMELEDAVTRHDLTETVDALADLLYVIHGMGSCLGLDLDKAFDIVHDSNMTKLCQNEREAQDTVKYYLENESRLGYDTPTYRVSEDGKYFVVYNASTGKVLKSINYVPANFESMLE